MLCYSVSISWVEGGLGSSVAPSLCDSRNATASPGKHSSLYMKCQDATGATRVCAPSRIGCKMSLGRWASCALLHPVCLKWQAFLSHAWTLAMLSLHPAAPLKTHSLFCRVHGRSAGAQHPSCEGLQVTSYLSSPGPRGVQARHGYAA